MKIALIVVGMASTFCRFSQFTIDLRQGNIVKYPP